MTSFEYTLYLSLSYQAISLHHYKREEEILASKENPKAYNDEVIWPDKVAINREYIKNWSFKKDIEYIFKTVRG